MKSMTKANGTKTPAFTPTNLNLTSPPVNFARLAINNYGQIVGTIGALNFEQAFL